MSTIFLETLRKYSPFPYVNRECVADYKIPGTDITLEKGMGVIIPIKNIHHNEAIYKHPMEFDPGRFSQQQRSERNQYAHIPFGEGPRICIGT